jgi:LysM repeat protein
VIARRYGVTVRAIQDSNGMGRRTLIRVNQLLLVPTSTASRYSGTLAASAPQPTGERGEVMQHRVRPGDTLYGVSRRYGTTPAAIAAASGIGVDRTLQIGDRLTVVRGVREATAAKSIAGQNQKTPILVSSSASQVHTVRRGDTLWDIASVYRTSVSALCALNSISPGSTLRPGTRLTVRLN